jgi:hypothetical protein
MENFADVFNLAVADFLPGRDGAVRRAQIAVILGNSVLQN